MREKSQGYPETNVIDLDGAIDAFMLFRRVGNATRQTLGYYTTCLSRFAGLVSFALHPAPSGTSMRITPPPSPPLAAITPTVVEQYLDLLRRQRHVNVLRDGTEVEKALSASTLHKHYRALKAFLRWAADAGLVPHSPLRVRMKTPRTLPRTPDDHAVELLLQHAGEGFWGARNRLLISLFLDCGLRLTELLRVRLSDIDYGTRTIRIVGKGERDDSQPFGQEAARRIREFVRQHRWNAAPDDYLITDADGQPVRADSITHVFLTISKRAGLPHPVTPHKLRHYFGCAVLKASSDLELTRQLLRHSTLHMALQYARLTKTDVLRKYQRSSPLDRLTRH